MKTTFSAAGCGLLFGVGLVISGMTRPDKVIGFLDLFGAFDPTLAFVMVGAIAVHLPLRRLVVKRPSPVMGARFLEPAPAAIDGRLLTGAVLFGVGWGVTGYCPGPGVVAIVPGGTPALIFFGAMGLGMCVHRVVFAQKTKSGDGPED